MKIKVKNRSGSTVGYLIPEMNLNRTYTALETKTIESEEIERLSFQPGGQALIDSFLQILNKEVAEEYCELAKEKEYWMSEEDVKELIINGSLDAFLDCLDWAPEGVIEMIKDLGVKAPMTDTQKMIAFKDHTGFDMDKAIKFSTGNTEDDKNVDTRKRRVTDEDTSAKPKKYNVIS